MVLNYTLTQKAIDAISADKNLQLRLSVLMGIGYMAIHMDIKGKQGGNIAKNYDAITYLEKHLKLPISQIRKKQAV